MGRGAPKSSACVAGAKTKQSVAGESFRAYRPARATAPRQAIWMKDPCERRTYLRPKRSGGRGATAPIRPTGGRAAPDRAQERRGPVGHAGRASGRKRGGGPRAGATTTPRRETSRDINQAAARSRHPPIWRWSRSGSDGTTRWPCGGSSVRIQRALHRDSRLTRWSRPLGGRLPLRAECGRGSGASWMQTPRVLRSQRRGWLRPAGGAAEQAWSGEGGAVVALASARRPTL